MSRFQAIKAYRLRLILDCQCEMLITAMKNLEGAIVGLLQGFSNGIMSYEDVSTRSEVGWYM